MDAFKAVFLPQLKLPADRKYFTIDEANRSLLLVSRIVGDILRDFKQLQELHFVCRSFGPHVDSLEAEEARRRYAGLNDHLAGLTEELEDLGCELKDYHTGLVEFPGRISDRPVVFQWEFGQDQIIHWHETGPRYTKV